MGCINSSFFNDTSQDPIIRLLFGDFSSINFELIKSIVPNFKLIIFFSSTFTDTHAERNIIMEIILPLLQAKAKPYGISVIFVDMRFGVKDENTKDHLTWIACADQIKYCFEESDGMFFMSLQGDKYGYRPIPKYIDKSTADSKILENRHSDDESVRSLFFEWYTVDENNLPPRYSLKPLLDRNDDNFWSNVLPKLRALLNGVAFDTASSPEIVIGNSVTEYEYLYAMSLAPERCSWFKRSFGDEITSDQDKGGNYCDFLKDNDNHNEARLKHKRLIYKMNSEILTGSCFPMSAPTLKSYMEKDDNFENYLFEFQREMTSVLDKELNYVIEKCVSWNENGDGRGLAGEDLSEMIHHTRVLEDKCSTFQGRENLIDASFKHIKEVSRQRSCLSSLKQCFMLSKNVLDVSLSIIGVSGSGKTALMSKLAQSCKSHFPFIPVIVRYCGTSKGTVDALGLITGICKQIQLIYKLPFDPIPTNYEEAVKFFHNLLLLYPVLLFIDSLDQLSNSYEARSKLSFLVGVKCHSKTHIIVSALPDEKDKNDPSKWKYIYLCDTRLSQMQVFRIVVSNFEEESKSVVSRLLALNKRTITDSQMKSLLYSLSLEPTALYLSLAVSVARQWESSFEIESENADSNTSEYIASSDITATTASTLSPFFYQSQKTSELQLSSINHRVDLKHGLLGTVKGLINQVFDQLENNYGIILTKLAVGFITFSRAGTLY